MALMLPLFAACSDDTDEMLEPEVIDTRVAPFGWELYYYTGYDKGYIKRWYKIDDENKRTYIYFHPKDEEIILQKIADKGIKIISNRVSTPIGSKKIDRNHGDDYDFFGALVGIQLACDYESVLNIPEVVGACPGFILEENNWGECPGTCVFYVFSSNMTVLKKIADKYNVHILGTWSGLPMPVSLCFCGKDSKGNALDICRDIIDSKMFNFHPFGVEPNLMTARLGGPSEYDD